MKIPWTSSASGSYVCLLLKNLDHFQDKLLSYVASSLISLQIIYEIQQYKKW